MKNSKSLNAKDRIGTEDYDWVNEGTFRYKGILVIIAFSPGRNREEWGGRAQFIDPKTDELISLVSLENNATDAAKMICNDIDDYL